MNSKKLIWIGMVVGSTVGGLIPSLWNAGIFSFSSIILSGVGAIVGVYIAFKVTHE